MPVHDARRYVHDRTHRIRTTWTVNISKMISWTILFIFYCIQIQIVNNLNVLKFSFGIARTMERNSRPYSSIVSNRVTVTRWFTVDRFFLSIRYLKRRHKQPYSRLKRAQRQTNVTMWPAVCAGPSTSIQNKDVGQLIWCKTEVRGTTRASEN